MWCSRSAGDFHAAFQCAVVPPIPHTRSFAVRSTSEENGKFSPLFVVVLLNDVFFHITRLLSTLSDASGADEKLSIFSFLRAESQCFRVHGGRLPFFFLSLSFSIEYFHSYNTLTFYRPNSSNDISS